VVFTKSLVGQRVAFPATVRLLKVMSTVPVL